MDSDVVVCNSEDEVRKAIEACQSFSIAASLTTLMLIGQLNGNETITTEGAKYLSEALKFNSTLTELNLAENEVGDDGVEYLSEALTVNSTLTLLDLEDNRMGYYGTKFLSEALKVNSTLTQLNLKSNYLGAEGAKYLSDALTVNSTLTQLKLEMVELAEGVKYWCDALKVNSTLTQLNLGWNKMGDEGAKCLSEVLKVNSTLAQLDLEWNELGVEAAKYLSDALQINSTLTHLYLGGNNVSTEGAKYLSEALKVNSTLAQLNINVNNVEAEGVKYLSEALKVNSALTHLHLIANLVGNEGVGYLSDTLKFNSTLSHLSLASNNVRAEGAKYLCEALKLNSTLTHLMLESNDLGDTGAKHLSEALKFNSTLARLNLGMNYINVEGAKYLGEALRFNSTLTHLKLLRNPVGRQGAKYLCEALRVNESIIDLLISASYLEKADKARISECISRNQQLASMNITDELVSFLDEKYLLNVTIRLKSGEKVRAHGIVLAARSRLFRNLLMEKANQQQRQAGEDILIDVDVDIPPQYLYILLRYLYSGVLDITGIHKREERYEFVRMVSELVPEHTSSIKRLMAEQLRSMSTPSNCQNTSTKEMIWAINNDLFHDVVFVVSDGEKNTKRIKAHRVVLSARSPYFKALLTGGMKESQEKEIHLHETNPIALIKVLEYLYTKDLKVVGSMPIELIIDTFVLASHYQVEPLKYKLEIMLSLNITVENVCQLLLLANTYECVKLKGECCKFFVEHREQIVETSSQQQDFYQQHITLIEQIINDYASHCETGETVR